eukprot:1824925-Rhodomonas_salina.1
MLHTSSLTRGWVWGQVKDVEQKKNEVEAHRDLLRQEISKLEREIEGQRRQIELDKKNIEVRPLGSRDLGLESEE